MPLRMAFFPSLAPNISKVENIMVYAECTLLCDQVGNRSQFLFLHSFKLILCYYPTTGKKTRYFRMPQYSPESLIDRRADDAFEIDHEVATRVMFTFLIRGLMCRTHSETHMKYKNANSI